MCRDIPFLQCKEGVPSTGGCHYLLSSILLSHKYYIRYARHPPYQANVLHPRAFKTAFSLDLHPIVQHQGQRRLTRASFKPSPELQCKLPSNHSNAVPSADKQARGGLARTFDKTLRACAPAKKRRRCSRHIYQPSSPSPEAQISALLFSRGTKISYHLLQRRIYQTSPRSGPDSCLLHCCQRKQCLEELFIGGWLWTR